MSSTYQSGIGQGQDEQKRGSGRTEGRGEKQKACRERSAQTGASEMERTSLALEIVVGR